MRRLLVCVFITAAAALAFAGPGLGITIDSTMHGTGASASPLGVSTSVIQARVTGSCTAGTAVGAVNSDGTVTCNAAGSTYTAGTGLQLVGTIFSLNETGATCSAGQSLTAMSSSGVGTCSTVLTTPGAGLATSGGGDVHVNLTTTSCSAGQAETTTAANGTSTCSTFINTGTNGVTCTGSTCSLDSTYSPTFAGLTDTGQFATSGTITVTDSGTINDYAPAGLASASTIVFNNTSNLTLTGITGGVSGRWLTLCAVNTGAVALNPETVSTASAAANRFNLTGGSSASIAAGGSNKISCTQILYIGGTINRWTQPSMPASTAVVPPLVLSSVLTANASETLQGSLQFSGTAHIRTATVSPPAVSSCGTGATVVGGDSMMTVTTGTGATGCTVTYGGTAWGSNHPACIVYPEGGAAFPAITYSGVTSFALGTGTAASTSYDIVCMGTN